MKIGIKLKPLKDKLMLSSPMKKSIGSKGLEQIGSEKGIETQNASMKKLRQEKRRTKYRESWMNMKNGLRKQKISKGCSVIILLICSH